MMIRTSLSRPTSVLLHAAFGTLVVFWAVDAGRALGSDAVDFARDVRPILSNHCFKCHGPDEATREAGLRLDTPEGAYEAAVMPHDPEDSELIVRIATDDEYMRMPPVDSGLELTAAQIDVLRRWIEQGAVYDQHWAFRTIRRPAVPRAQSDAGDAPGDTAPQAATSVIDRFIDHKLQSMDLERSPGADRVTLVRRVYLDLLGVLPSPAAIDQFVDDTSPDAYERLVDRVLANPHFGEKWGRHWLDQARYADSNGYTIDSPRTMWPYRDWVIRAINEDKPFDQFTVEQLAGDLLPDPTVDQFVATGFHRNTLINQEGGTDAEQFRNEATVDRVNTTGAVWLGLTVGCAQCHTHKYDPLTHSEYYQLFAFFNQAQDKNSTSPTVAVATPEQQKRIDTLARRVAEAEAALAAYDRLRQAEQPDEPADSGEPVAWTVVQAEAPRSDAGATFERLSDGSFVVSGNNADEDTYTVSFPLPSGRISGVRLETLTHPSLPKGGPGRAGNGNFVLGEIDFRVDGRDAKWLHASADHSQENYDVAFAIDDDPSSGWAINGAKRLNINRTATFALEPMAIGNEAERAQARGVMTLKFGPRPAQYNIGRFRLSVTGASLRQLGVPDPERKPLELAVEQAKNERAKFTRSIPQTMIMRDIEQPRQTHRQIRGDFLRPGEEVEAATPAFLPEMTSEDEAATRLDLARWLADPDNPLTARVTVNRIWMRLFGQGLVETENDFGFQGTPPTHPALLDWLASEFIEEDWSVKHLIRTIVCSATYRQSSVTRQPAQQIDPLNKYLARQSRIRVDAEIVRDLVNSASGLLDRRVGGPSVYPPQPDGVYAFTQRQASWPTSQGGDRYRRGMYTFFMRSAPHPMLTTFDAPAFNTTCTRRVRSNTPLQSLTLANDQAMIEAARGLAKRLIAAAPLESKNAAVDPADDAARVATAYARCFSRPPTPGERERLVTFLQTQRNHFLQSPESAAALAGVEADADAEEARDTADLAATVLLARVLMNLDEFITRE